MRGEIWGRVLKIGKEVAQWECLPKEMVNHPLGLKVNDGGRTAGCWKSFSIVVCIPSSSLMVPPSLIAIALSCICSPSSSFVVVPFGFQFQGRCQLLLILLFHFDCRRFTIFLPSSLIKDCWCCCLQVSLLRSMFIAQLVVFVKFIGAVILFHVSLNGHWHCHVFSCIDMQLLSVAAFKVWISNLFFSGHP